MFKHQGSKVKGEKLVHIARYNGLPVTIVRPSNVVGLSLFLNISTDLEARTLQEKSEL